MKRIAPIAVAVITLFNSCSSDNEPNPSNGNPGNNSGGKVAISETSPEFTFWGDELTITGTGFSEIKDENVITFVNSYPKTPDLKLTSKDGDIEIVSASQTKLVIRVPYFTQEVQQVMHARGEDFAQIEVKVKNEADTSDIVKFLGLPRIGNFEYHYGWYDLGGVARSGDSVILGGGFYGSKRWAGEDHHKQAGTYDKLRLRVDGIDVPIKYRTISSSTHGWAMYLPTHEFSEVNCDEGTGWGARKMLFEFYVLGTDKKASRELSVTYLPEQEVTTVAGPTTVSKFAGGNPFWEVTGKDMYYDKVRFVPATCLVSNVEVGVNPGGISSSFTIGIPLSLLVEGCMYNVILGTPCDNFKNIGQIFITP